MGEIKNSLDEIRFCGEKNSDGINEDVYVMMRNFDVRSGEFKPYVHFYYPSDNYIVTDVEVQ